MRFEIIRMIGQGGLGSVYRGRDHETNQQVAIKMVPSVAGEPPYLVHEYEVLSKLRHPNVVRVIDKFYLDRQLCFAMEIIDGIALPDALAQEPKYNLASGTRHLFGQLQDALDYIHDAGVIHAELSPHNILVKADGTLKIVDFEHARWIDGRDDDLWPCGTFAGTPLYSSPEHFTAARLAPESDYFVVGILLAEHLAGGHPFRDRGLRQIVSRVSSAQFVEALDIQSLGADERDVISLLLSLDPAARRDGWERLKLQLRLEDGSGPVVRDVVSVARTKERSVFISHASADKPLARRLARDLADRGFAVWLDEWRIKAGDSITRGIDDALASCEFVVLLLSNESIGSPWVEREWRAAYWREIESRKLHLIPALVNDCAIPALLRDKKYVRLQEWNEAVTELAAAMAGA